MGSGAAAAAAASGTLHSSGCPSRMMSDRAAPAGDPRPALARPPLPAGVRTVREEPVRADVPALAHPEWLRSFPWLLQGVTRRTSDSRPADFSLFGDGRTADVTERWERLRVGRGMHGVAHGRQVHGAVVRLHGALPEGLTVLPGTDGHGTRTPGTLLTVSVADCVPVTLVVPRSRAVVLLHAGWRGTAAGILEAGLELLAERLARDPGEAHLHLGPAICGTCYEVGPEVHEGLGLEVPSSATPVDLRAALAGRAVASGVEPGRITVSGLCTRCGDAGLFSHRGGDPERQVAFAGVIP